MTDYIIHKLAYKNNIKKIKKILEKDKSLLYSIMQGEYPIHIACLIGSKKLIDLFLDYDKNILKLKNTKGQTGYHSLILYPNILIEKLKKKSKNFDINTPDNLGYTILISYLLTNKKVDIKVIKKLKELGADINKPKNNSKIDKVLVKNCDLLDKIIKIFDVDINAYNSIGLTPMHTMIFNNNIDCIKKLIKHNANIRNSGIDSKYNIFEYALRYGNNEIINILLKQDIDYEYTNHYGDTYLHGILMSRKNSYSKEIIRNLLENTSNLNIQNIDGSTVIHLLIKTGLWKQYDNILNKKNIDFSLINKERKKPLDYLSKKDKKKFKKKILINKKKLSKCKSDKNIKFLNFRKVNYTLFTAYTRDIFIYQIILLRKYSNLGLPFCNNKKNKSLPNKFLKGDKMQRTFAHNIKTLYENFNGLLCTEIYWHNSELYFIHDDFYNAIRKKMHKELIFFNICLTNLSVNHANIVLIDNTLETIERFDSFGVMDYNEVDKLDQLLDKELNKIILKKKNKKYKYLAPKDYLRINSFQSLSRHDSIENKNIGDIGGFCLAWCFWYIESRLNNPGIKQYILVDKLERKLINNKLTISRYIRSYANKLSLEKAKLLKEFKILPSEYYKVFPGNKEIIKLYRLVFNNLQQLSKKL